MTAPPFLSDHLAHLLGAALTRPDLIAHARAEGELEEVSEP